MDLQGSPLSCTDDATGTQIEFENPSDALFARLFLKADGVPWTFFDTILDTIRNPAFSPGEVTLSDYGGLLTRIAETREKKLKAIGGRRFQSGDVYVSTGVPDVVRDAMFDLLREEIRYANSILRRSMYACVVDFPHDKAWEVLEDARASAAMCSRVHSSWLMGARKVLGYEHELGPDQASLSDSMRSPWIGSDTRELLVNPVDEPDCLPLIRPLFTRLNNIRHIELVFRQESKFEELDLVHICAALSLLPTVEEVVFCLRDLLEAPIHALSKSILPMLKTLRFLIDSQIELFLPDGLPTSLVPLRTFQSLRSIHIDSSRPSFLKGISWSESADDSQMMTLHELFIDSANARIGDMWFESRSREGEGTLGTMLQSARRIHYNDIWNPDANLAAMFSRCTSLLWLGITSEHGLPESDFMYDTLKRMPSSLERMLIAIPSADIEITLRQLDEWDVQVASALSDGASSNLRELEVCLEVRRETASANPHIHIVENRQLWRRNPAQLKRIVMNESGVENMGAEEGLSPLLPRCEEECTKRGIRFAAVAM